MKIPEGIRMAWKRWTSSLLLLVPAVLPQAHAQTADSLLQWINFRTYVLETHPLARQADLSIGQAEASLLRAKGGFDPKLFSEFTEKSFQSSQYFRYAEAGVKWPSWMGLEVKGAYNWASGVYLNPESNLPQVGQAALGLTWTLGQGLFIDERRADLRQANIGLQFGAAERDALLNDLLFQGAKVYWEWVLANTQVSVFENALQQAEVRFNGIKESYLQGDHPAIDTLEAFIQVQNRLMDLNFAQVDRQNALLALNTFLWNENGLPLQATEIERPPLLPDAQAPVPPPFDTLIQGLTAHPLLRQYQAKLEGLAVEQRLKQEKRKPIIDVQYNLLGNGWEFFPTNTTEGIAVLANDIKWGINFAYPIPNRKARGDFQVTAIKVAQTSYEQQQKRIDLENKLRSYANECDNLRRQIDLYRQMTDNYRALLDGENEKFRFGESSVFLVNAREQRWLDARIKLLKLQSEYRKAEAGLLWIAGVIKDY